MTEAVIERIIQYGVLGPLLVAAVMIVWQQQKMLHKALDRFRDAQDKRAQDAQAVVDRVLDLNNRFNDTLSGQLKFLEATEARTDTLAQNVHDIVLALQELRVAQAQQAQQAAAPLPALPPAPSAPKPKGGR